MTAIAGFNAQVDITEFRKGSVIAVYEMNLLSLDVSLVDISSSLTFAASVMLTASNMSEFSGIFPLSALDTANISVVKLNSSQLPPGTEYNLTQTAIAGSIKINNNITIDGWGNGTSNSTIISSDNWPDDLDDPNSALFKRMVKIFTPIVSRGCIVFGNILKNYWFLYTNYRLKSF